MNTNRQNKASLTKVQLENKIVEYLNILYTHHNISLKEFKNIKSDKIRNVLLNNNVINTNLKLNQYVNVWKKYIDEDFNNDINELFLEKYTLQLKVSNFVENLINSKVLSFLLKRGFENDATDTNSLL